MNIANQITSLGLISNEDRIELGKVSSVRKAANRLNDVEFFSLTDIGASNGYNLIQNGTAT